MARVMAEIGNRADVAVVTGGLGPTQDDITAASAAKAGGVELAEDKNALDSIEGFFKARNHPMSVSNRKQAMLPKGAVCLYNPIGTAPGFQVDIGRCHFFCLPGVPHEMRRMLSDEVIPRVQQIKGDSHISYLVKTVSIFGLTESVTGERLSILEDKFPEIKLGLRATFPIIHVKMYASSEDRRHICDTLEAAASWVMAEVGDKAFAVDGSPMETVVGNLLRDKKATLAVAESCTGGLLSNWLTDVPGSSDYFLFSGVTYSNEAKAKVLSVSPETIERYGAVHEQTAKEMADGARRIVGATYGISTTGIAGPYGGTDEKPVGTVCIGLSGPDSTRASRYTLNYGDRLRNKTMFAMVALNLLRRELLKVS
jgi:nicotinamide-nucleotide amidase